MGSRPSVLSTEDQASCPIPVSEMGRQLYPSPNNIESAWFIWAHGRDKELEQPRSETSRTWGACFKPRGFRGTKGSIAEEIQSASLLLCDHDIAWSRGNPESQTRVLDGGQEQGGGWHQAAAPRAPAARPLLRAHGLGEGRTRCSLPLWVSLRHVIHSSKKKKSLPDRRCTLCGSLTLSPTKARSGCPHPPVPDGGSSVPLGEKGRQQGPPPMFSPRVAHRVIPRPTLLDQEPSVG